MFYTCGELGFWAVALYSDGASNVCETDGCSLTINDAVKKGHETMKRLSELGMTDIWYVINSDLNGTRVKELHYHSAIRRSDVISFDHVEHL